MKDRCCICSVTVTVLVEKQTLWIHNIADIMLLCTIGEVMKIPNLR